MSDLRDLYQELILDHNRRPRNFGRLDAANRSAEGYNPLCGDKVTVYLKMENDSVKDVRFEGAGCAISKASASVMTESVKGMSRSQVEALFKKFHELVTGRPTADGAEGLGKLAAFSGVAEYPTRVKCATLAWHTLRAALSGADKTISTE
jgi:nitrogen fixation NifU-like protein